MLVPRPVMHDAGPVDSPVRGGGAPAMRGLRLVGLTPAADVVLQHGLLFSGPTVDGPPRVIYTDVTHRLVEREDPWRDAIPEIVVDGETGWLVEPGNVAPLAEALERLLLDEPLRRAVGVRGRERALRAFRWDQMDERMLPQPWRAAHAPSRETVYV